MKVIRGGLVSLQFRSGSRITMHSLSFSRTSHRGPLIWISATVDSPQGFGAVVTWTFMLKYSLEGKPTVKYSFYVPFRLTGSFEHLTPEGRLDCLLCDGTVNSGLIYLHDVVELLYRSSSRPSMLPPSISASFNLTFQRESQGIIACRGDRAHVFLRVMQAVQDPSILHCRSVGGVLRSMYAAAGVHTVRDSS